jgi:hypothetical protein
LSWSTNLRRILVNLARLPVRLAAYPFVTRLNRFRGRRVADPSLFLIEPIVNFTEMFGLLVGRTLKLRYFR